jgi:hypothetical protein
LAMVTYTAGALNKWVYAEQFGTISFFNEPGVAVVQALMLRFQPVFMDILPLYIVLLLVLPVVLAGFRSWPAVVFLPSFTLWLAVQFDSRVALSVYPGPDRMWFLNPLAWQALFILGAWFGWRNIHGGIPWFSQRWLLWLAAGLSCVGFLIRFNWTLHGFYAAIPVFVSGKAGWPFLSKTDLGLLRLANVLAVALLMANLIPRGARFLASAAAWPFLLCGRNSLVIFCLLTLLSVLGQLTLNEFFGGLFVQFAFSVTGIVIMVAIAALLELIRRSAGQAQWQRR